mgnify:CR=1 FL=1
MKGTTKTGFEFDVDPQKLDDWEILDQLSEMEHAVLNAVRDTDPQNLTCSG